MSTEDICVHCKLPIPPADLVIADIDGAKLHFCCHGCSGVYRIITGAGLKSFYSQRDWETQGVPDGVFETRFDETSLAGHVASISDTSAEILLIIEGIRCSSCVWLLEKLLVKERGIEAIRINYGSHRALIRFNPLQTSPTRIFDAVTRLGYLPHPFTAGEAQKTAAREQRTLLIRFGTAAFLSMQLMGFSFALYGGYFHGIDPSVRQIIQYFAAAVTTPVVFYSGWPFLSGALRSIRNRAPSMDLLISLGVLTAYTYSLYTLVFGGEVYFDTAAMIITLILLGRLFEGSARSRSVSGIDKLLQLAPETAHRITGDEIRPVASASLMPGETIMVRPGERIPVDCIILEGETELDEASISGEPLPVLRRTGERVSSGSLNLATSVKMTVERPAAESFIARMAQMVEDAQLRKAPIQSLADQVATIFVPFITLTALGTWVYWTLSGAAASTALLNAVSVLIVACPCALGLATPTAVLVASGNAAGRGLFFRGGDVLERTARINQVAFDKTGTLTLGKPTVSKVIPAPGQTESGLLLLAHRLECGSTHPIARGIAERAKEYGVKADIATSVTTVPGRGLKMCDEQGEVLVGSRLFLQEHDVEVPPATFGTLTEVYVALNGDWQGVLLMQDPIRDEAHQTIAKLQRFKLRTVLLTGDRRETAHRVSQQLGITDIYAEQSPADKAEWIRTAQHSGATVMMVGDGINDAPSLSQADVGCSMAGGTDIALEASDLVLTRPNLSRIYEALFIARQTLLVIKQNLFWAFAYNIVTVPLAASGKLAPVWAALAMASSSVLVVNNSLRLGRKIRRTFLSCQKNDKRLESTNV